MRRTVLLLFGKPMIGRDKKVETGAKSCFNNADILAGKMLIMLIQLAALQKDISTFGHSVDTRVINVVKINAPRYSGFRPLHTGALSGLPWLVVSGNHVESLCSLRSSAYQNIHFRPRTSLTITGTMRPFDLV